MQTLSERIKILNANRNHKKAIPVSNKINFKTKTVITDKIGHYILIKESIQSNKDDITFANIYMSTTGAPKYKARQGTWLTQSEEHATLDFHVEFKPHVQWKNHLKIKSLNTHN